MQDPLPLHRLGINHHFDAAISGPARFGAIRDDRMASAVADHKELPCRHSAAAGQASYTAIDWATARCWSVGYCGEVIGLPSVWPSMPTKCCG